MPRRTTHITPTSNTATNACGRLLRVDDGTGYQMFSCCGGFDVLRFAIERCTEPFFTPSGLY